MTLDLVLVVGGSALLAYAGARLVDFAAAVAERARLTPAVIGLTVVAAGTSAPELAVSLNGALRGSGGIAMGNVVGSNIANVGLILGVCAAIAAIPVARGVLRFEYPFLVLTSWIALLLSRDGSIDRLEGAFFVASMIAFTAYAVWVARREVGAALQERVAESLPARAEGLSRRPAWVLALGVLASLAGLVVGGDALVRGAVGIAAGLGVSERVIGLTVVAIGTSLPELAVSLAAAMKGQQDMAIANVVGSNVFNLLLILGAAGVVRPIAVDPRIVAVDLWVMMGFTLLVFALVVRRHQLSRAGGLTLLSAYLGYLAWLALSPA
jgi:cation:H+ antiporter